MVIKRLGCAALVASQLFACGKTESGKETTPAEEPAPLGETASGQTEKELQQLKKQLLELKLMISEASKTNSDSADLEALRNQMAALVENINGNNSEPSFAFNEDLQTLKNNMDSIHSEIKNNASHLNSMEANEDLKGQIEGILTRISDLQQGFASIGGVQKAFLRQCVASLEAHDGDQEFRHVANAIALINSSKVAKATPIAQADFDRLSDAQSNEQNSSQGLVLVGTKAEQRAEDQNYTYYAYSRLPSPGLGHKNIFHNLSQGEHGLKFGQASADLFYLGDDQGNQKSIDQYEVLASQNPLQAIDAHKIESYTRDDCERIATYMANVGSKALSDRIDRPHYKTLQAAGESDFKFIEDLFAQLNLRYETKTKDDLERRSFADSDSTRVMVLQDDLMRKGPDGKIDYSFLNLIEAPHLRFFGALDSNIGLAQKNSGSDFDNEYTGKAEDLIAFVQRHRTQAHKARGDKNFKDLEAVFVRLQVEDAPQPEPQTRELGHNLFHAPN